MNVGLLGAGWFGREAHLRNLVRLPEVNVVAVASRSSENRQAAMGIVGEKVLAVSDWRDVLNIESIDAVVISLPNERHAEAAVAAFRAGKHVLCEKPMGLTVAECDQVIAEADAAGKILQVGHEMRFQRLYQRMHSMVCADSIGDPRIMWCREYRGPMRPGWRSSEALTGGMLLEKNCHHFDLFNWMLSSRPLRVAAFGGRDVLTDREILDNAQVLVEYEDSRRAVLEICLFAPSGSDCEIGIVGSRGRIDTKNQAMTLCCHEFESGTQHEERFSAHEDEASYTDAAGRVDRGIRAELEHFLDCCRTSRTPLTDGSSARLTTAVCLAAQEAIRRKQVVTIGEILNEH